MYKNFKARLKQANLTAKAEIAGLVKKTDFGDTLKTLNKTTTSNKTKYVLVENEFKKLQANDLSLFIGQSYFFNDGSLFFLIFQPIFNTFTGGLRDTIIERGPTKVSSEKIEPPITANHCLSSTF